MSPPNTVKVPLDPLWDYITSIHPQWIDVNGQTVRFGVRHVATYLAVHERTVLRWKHNGLLPGYAIQMADRCGYRVEQIWTDFEELTCHMRFK